MWFFSTDSFLCGETSRGESAAASRRQKQSGGRLSVASCRLLRYAARFAFPCVRGTLALVLEILVVLIVAATIGLIRPRWSSLWCAVVPASLTFAWLLMHEEVPGDPIGLGDVAWYVGTSLAVGAVFALACSLGITARSASVRRRARLPR